MTDTPHDLAAVEQLLAERDALHGWLTRLGQAGAGVPEPVRERVRRDYEQRLAQLTDGLREHADTIAAKLDEDRAEHATLLSRATAAQDALAEAELRHAVGEYEEARYEAERTRHGSDLETFELSRRAVAERIARLEDVQAMVTRAPRLADEAPIADDGDVVVVEIEEESIEIAELAPDGEAEGLLTIFDEAAEPAAPEAPAAAPARSANDFAPLSFRPSGAPPSDLARPAAPPPRVPRPADSAVPIGIPIASQPPQFIRPGERLKSEPAAPDAIFAKEIIATGPAPEVVTVPVGRTLRCGECGAMNRPLEWYCEKCGAELTAV